MFCLFHLSKIKGESSQEFSESESDMREEEFQCSACLRIEMGRENFIRHLRMSCFPDDDLLSDDELIKTCKVSDGLSMDEATNETLSSEESESEFQEEEFKCSVCSSVEMGRENFIRHLRMSCFPDDDLLSDDELIKITRA